jgi:hypothetical protein
MSIPENFLTLHAEEERVRLVSLDHIASNAALLLHANVVEASLTALEHFSAGWLILLRHKLRRLRRAFLRAQQGHRSTLLTSAKISRRRRVAIELGT